MTENVTQSKAGQPLWPKLWLSGGNDRWQALAGVEVGQVLSFESCALGAPTVSRFTEGNTERLR